MNMYMSSSSGVDGCKLLHFSLLWYAAFIQTWLTR